MITIRTFTKQQLNEFIHSDEYRNMPILPISYHRAISHINNPRALDNDVLLIIAYEDNVMLGYLGVLPDDLYLHTNQKYHVGWLSCIWVSPNARGKGIAKKLVLTAYESYQQHIFITNFTKEAEKLYEKLNIFADLPALSGMRFYRKMCLANIIPNRFPKLQSLHKLFVFIDRIFNVFWHPNIFESQKKCHYKTIQSNAIHSEYLHSNEIGFRRTNTEFQWILHFPWIKQVNKISQDARKYHFSSEEFDFETHLLTIFANQQTIGQILYSIRNGHLKIPYIFCHPDNYKDLAKFLDCFVHQINPDFITVFEKPEIIPLLRFRRLYQKRIFRKFKITHTLYNKIDDLSKQKLFIFDGDGDAVFT
ncbi:MAG: GNAT family N-acetyltransferase [Bacteroidales bacterium]|nr:GNAT family N-acetyltransferase [Bacteroidales bacterium]